jgi:hypothetical protein
MTFFLPLKAKIEAIDKDMIGNKYNPKENPIRKNKDKKTNKSCLVFLFLKPSTLSKKKLKK